MFQRSRRRKTLNWHAEGANYPRITTSRFLECYDSSDKTGLWNYFLDAARDVSFPQHPAPAQRTSSEISEQVEFPPRTPHTQAIRSKSLPTFMAQKYGLASTAALGLDLPCPWPRLRLGRRQDTHRLRPCQCSYVRVTCTVKPHWSRYEHPKPMTATWNSRALASNCHDC